MAEEYVGRKFRTVFLDGEPDLVAVEDILSIGRQLNELGLTPENAGNISVRTRNGILITAGGINKGRMKAGDVVEVLGFENKKAQVLGNMEPSSEVPMHWLIYREFPQVNAVIHAHDSRVTENPLGRVVTDRVHPYGTLSQARDVVKALHKCNYIVIKKHGVIAVGETLKQAMELILKMYSG